MVYIAICVSMYPHPLFIQPQPKIFQMFSDIPNPQEYPGDCPNCGNPVGTPARCRRGFGAHEFVLRPISQGRRSLRRLRGRRRSPGMIPGVGRNREGGRGVQGVVMLQVRCLWDVFHGLNLRLLYPDLGMVIAVIPPSSSIHTNYHGLFLGFV